MTACPALSVTGKLAPVTANPAPATATELMVSAATPEEVSVTDWVVDALRLTLPKLRLFALAERPADCPCRVNAKSFDLPSGLVAVKSTVCVEETPTAVAVKVALADPAGTVTATGTVTAGLLLDRLTGTPPPEAAAESVTEQLSVAAPERVALVHRRELSVPATASPVPLRLTTAVAPPPALVLIVRDPVVAPAVAGSN